MVEPQPAELVEHRPVTPRRGSTLEGRVRSLLERRGYRATTNRIILDHEIDVWGVDRDGRVAIAECKEYYDSGPVSPAQVRNFFGKVYDIEKNYGENIYLALFVSISGFSPAARSLCDRLKILAIDADTLETLEKSQEEIVPRYSPLEDQAVIALRRQRDQLREELDRRLLVRQLSQRIEEYKIALETRTIPSFLVPSAQSTSFWYSQCEEIPFAGLNGEFQDFTVPRFPLISRLVYRRRRLIGHRELALSLSDSRMQGGVVYVNSDALGQASPVGEEDQPGLRQLAQAPVVTLDNTLLGVAADFRISWRQDAWQVDCIKVASGAQLRKQLANPDFTIPADRVSPKEVGDGWQLVAHVRLASEIAVPQNA